MVLEEVKDIIGVEADAIEAVEEAEQEEEVVLFDGTSSKEAADLVQNAPSPTIYRSRTRAVPHRNKGWQIRLRNNL